jgi:hypothetical protein
MFCLALFVVGNLSWLPLATSRSLMAGSSGENTITQEALRINFGNFTPIVELAGKEPKILPTESAGQVCFVSNTSTASLQLCSSKDYDILVDSKVRSNYFVVQAEGNKSLSIISFLAWKSS